MDTKPRCPLPRGETPQEVELHWNAQHARYSDEFVHKKLEPIRNELKRYVQQKYRDLRVVSADVLVESYNFTGKMESPSRIDFSSGRIEGKAVVRVRIGDVIWRITKELGYTSWYKSTSLTWPSTTTCRAIAFEIDTLLKESNSAHATAG